MLQTFPDAVVFFDFELMLNSLVNRYCHIEKLTPFYETFSRKSDPMTSKQCFKYNHPSKPLWLIRMDGLILKHFSWSGFVLLLLYIGFCYSRGTGVAGLDNVLLSRSSDLMDLLYRYIKHFERRTQAVRNTIYPHLVGCDCQ